MSQTIQEQIDELRTQLENVQTSVALRALKSEVNTMAVTQNTTMNEIIVKLDDLENCLIEIQNALIAARTQLRTHTH